MNRDELRLEYRKVTGDVPFERYNNWMKDQIKTPYFAWVEDKLIETINELEALYEIMKKDEELGGH